MTAKAENEILWAILRTHLERLYLLRDHTISPRYIRVREIRLWIAELEHMVKPVVRP